MPQDFVFALFLLGVGVLIIGVGAYLAYHQKVYFNPADNSVITEIEIPLIGKVKTNIPAIALCFIGLFPVYLGYKEMSNRAPTLVPFQGEVTLDGARAADVNAITVGITSSAWSTLATPSGHLSIPVTINVPDTWQSYSAYAFTFGAEPRLDIEGASPDRTFKLRIAP
jgi:hypothetical protein